MVQTSSSFNFPGIPTYFQHLNLVVPPRHFQTFVLRVGRFGWWQVLSHRRLKDWKRHWPLSPFGSTKPLCVLLNQDFPSIWQAKFGVICGRRKILPRPQNPVIIHNVMVLKGHLFFYRTPFSNSHEKKLVDVPVGTLHLTGISQTGYLSEHPKLDLFFSKNWSLVWVAMMSILVQILSTHLVWSVYQISTQVGCPTWKEAHPASEEVENRGWRVRAVQSWLWKRLVGRKRTHDSGFGPTNYISPIHCSNMMCMIWMFCVRLSASQIESANHALVRGGRGAFGGKAGFQPEQPPPFLDILTYPVRNEHIPPWEKENHLQRYLGWGSVSSHEGIHSFGTGNVVLFYLTDLIAWPLPSSSEHEHFAKHRQPEELQQPKQPTTCVRAQKVTTKIQVHWC